MKTLSFSTIAAVLVLVGSSSFAQAQSYQLRLPLQKVSATTGKAAESAPEGTTSNPTAPPVSTTSPAPAPPAESTESAQPATKTSQATLSASSIDYGPTATNTSVTRQLLLMNSGEATMRLQGSPQVTGSTAFALGLTNCGATLEPGQSCSVEVSYSPTSVRPDSGQVYFPSDAPNAPVTASLQGSAYNPVSLASAEIPGALMNYNYSYDFKPLLNVSNESSPDKVVANWRIVSGALPPGLTLNGASGVVSGTANTQTTATFTMRVTYRSNVAERQYTLKSGTMCYISAGECSNQPTEMEPIDGPQEYESYDPNNPNTQAPPADF